MKLFWSATSPFVRKVLVCAIERGVRDRLELVPVTVNPVGGPNPVSTHNPAGKIPCLLTDEGTAIFDSRVIVEHLDTLPGGPPLVPREPTMRMRALTLQSLADELTDAAVLLRYETFLRPEPLRWPEWIAGQRGKVQASLDQLERFFLAHLEAHFDVGAIATACALGYLDFRFPEEDWRASRPALARWQVQASTRPSLRETVPKG
jgi:glutathione S-transferase